MSFHTLNLNLNYNRPIKISEDIYWVGFYDKEACLHSNPYLIIDGDEAVVIDSGSRPDFPTVMMKILQVGINPSSIKALIYQHYDPDLVGNIANFEDVIRNDDLKVISDTSNNLFIRYYSTSSPLYSLESVRHKFKFSSGRELLFYNTPYSHSQGSLITFDTKSQVLFTSDIFGSFDTKWELFLDLDSDCHSCKDMKKCLLEKPYCPINDIIRFHQNIMTSNKALRYSLDIIKDIPAKMIAPQHGSIIHKIEDIKFLMDVLYSIEDIGIDGIAKG